MTSGTFASLPISSLWLNRAFRQRRDLTDIPALADSIRRLGLIHPPVVTREHEVKAGERRWEACKSLGWTSIPVQFTDELDPRQLLLIELEENIRRVDISWQENCHAVQQYHDMRKADAITWTAVDTAEAIGESARSVQEKLAVFAEMKRSPLIGEARGIGTAKNMTRRATERRNSAQLQLLDPQAPQEVPLVCADFRTWTSDRKFNFIHCDFPYGINFQDADRQTSAPMEAFDDTFQTYSDLCDILERAPVAESAHLIFWFSMEHYVWTYDRLTRMGWKLDRFPLVWSKVNSGLLPDPNRGPRRVYETAFFAAHGDRKVVQAVGNLVSVTPGERSHISEKPREVLRHFFRMVVDEYTIFLDPTCGSGNAVKVAQLLGAGYVIGLEKEKSFYDEAVLNYMKD